MIANNATLFKFSDITVEAIAAAIRSRPFVSCGPTDLSSSGFAPPVSGGNLVMSFPEFSVIALKTETKLLPGSVVREALARRVVLLDAKQGHRVGRKQKAELKEQIILELLPRAFTRSTITRAWFDFSDGLFVVDSASNTDVDAVIEALFKADCGARFVPWRTHFPADTAMAEWVRNSAPWPFTVDDSALFTSITGGTIRINNHNIATDEISHLAATKTVRELRLTFDERISFTLTEELQLKRINHLYIESQPAADSQEEQLEADIALNVLSIRNAFDAITEALGGLLEVA